MNIHTDFTIVLLLPMAILYVLGVFSFELAVVLLLTFGLPYGGPPQ